MSDRRTPVAHAPGSPRWKSHFLRWSPILVLAGFLLFCHGCHGEDEDNELSVGVPHVQQTQQGSPR